MRALDDDDDDEEECMHAPRRKIDSKKKGSTKYILYTSVHTMNTCLFYAHSLTTKCRRIRGRRRRRIVFLREIVHLTTPKPITLSINYFIPTLFKNVLTQVSFLFFSSTVKYTSPHTHTPGAVKIMNNFPIITLYGSHDKSALCPLKLFRWTLSSENYINRFLLLIIATFKIFKRVNNFSNPFGNWIFYFP